MLNDMKLGEKGNWFSPNKGLNLGDEWMVGNELLAAHIELCTIW